MMQHTLIFLGIVFIITAMVKELSKTTDVKNEPDALDDYKVNDTKDTIETGFPTPATKSLHINGTKEPPLPNHSFSDEALSRFQLEDDSTTSKKDIHTVNLYVESHYQLNLSLFGSDLTIQMVNDAYEKILNVHIENIRNGIPEEFNTEDKKRARDYLIGTLTKESER
jgi:hypothetical protein